MLGITHYPFRFVKKSGALIHSQQHKVGHHPTRHKAAGSQGPPPFLFNDHDLFYFVKIFHEKHRHAVFKERMAWSYAKFRVFLKKVWRVFKESFAWSCNTLWHKKLQRGHKEVVKSQDFSSSSLEIKK